MSAPKRFVLRRGFMPINHRYELRPRRADGTVEPAIAWVRAAFKLTSVYVTFYADKARAQPLFGLVGRTGEDGYEVTDSDGRLIGEIRKNDVESVLRSTWEFTTPEGLTAVGRERSAGIAAARRVLDLFGTSPLLFHFDFVTDTGDAVLSSERQLSIRPRFHVTLPLLSDGTQLDWRIGAAMAVALHTL